MDGDQPMTEEQIQAELNRTRSTFVDTGQNFAGDQQLASRLLSGGGQQPAAPAPEADPALEDQPAEGGESTADPAGNTGPTDEQLEIDRRAKRQGELSNIQNQDYSSFERQLSSRVRVQSASEIAEKNGVEMPEAERLRDDQMRENQDVVRRSVETKKMLDRESQRVIVDFPELDRESKSYVGELYNDFQDLYRSEYQNPVLNRDLNEIERANGPYRLAKTLVDAHRRSSEMNKEKWISEGVEKARAANSKAASTKSAPKSTQSKQAPKASDQDVIADHLFAGVDALY